MSTGQPVVAETPWRVRLARRLTQLTIAATLLVFAPLVFGTVEPVRRNFMLVVSACLVLTLAWLAREQTPDRLRSMGVVATFVVVGIAGYGAVGFLAAPGVAFAAAIAMAGLLLGRRALFVTVGATAVVITIIGVLMVSGTLPPPRPMTSR